MKPSQVAPLLKAMLAIHRPVMIWGAPGVGKSEIVYQIAQNIDHELREMRLSIMDPTEVKGILFPNTKTKEANWYFPETLPKKGKGILFIDEINTAPPAVQAAAYQLILNRKLGEYELPEGWRIVAAGNRMGDRGVTYQMPSPLANRFVHIDLEPDLDDYCLHATKSGVSDDNIAFLRYRPDLLHKFDAAANPRAFPTPRTWFFVDEISKLGLPPLLELEAIKGTVGEGPASERAAFMKTIKNMPKIDEILLNPDKVKVPEEPSVLYALSTALANFASENNFDRLMRYTERMPVEFQVVTVRSALRREVGCDETKAYQKWAIKNSSVLI